MNGIPENQMLENAPNADLIIGTGKRKNDIPYGYCQCGCGGKTPMAKHTSTRDKTIKGKPLRYLPAHSLKKYNKKGGENPNWKGGKTKIAGYFWIIKPDHPNNCSGYISVATLVAEKALGKFLPKKAMVHHVDCNKENNKNSNLVVCQDRAYHNMLHRRMKALIECGHASWRKCRYCKKYDEPENMYCPPSGESPRHRSCYNKFMRGYRKSTGRLYQNENLSV